MFPAEFNSKFKATSLVSVSLAACATAIAFQSPTQAGTQNISKRLIELSETMNQSLPVMLNQEISMDSTSIKPGKTLNYNLRFVNRSAMDVDGGHYAEMIRPSMIRHVCDNLYNPFFRKNEVSVSMRFYDSHRNFFSMVKVAPDDCRS